MKKIISLFTVFIMFCSQVGAVPVYGVFVKDKDTNKSKIKTFFAQKKELNLFPLAYYSIMKQARKEANP